MKFPLTILLALQLVGIVAAALDDRTTTLYQWPLTASTPAPLAEISYNADTLTASYRPSSTARVVSDEPTRIGVRSGSSEKWVGTAVSLSDEGHPLVTLHVDNDGEVWHVEFTQDPLATETKVEIKRAGASDGAKPILNRPVVLNPDGKLPVPEVEKTFLQKYWWVLLAGMFLVVGSGGGE